MALHVAAQDKVKLSGRVIDDEQNPVLFAVVKVDGKPQVLPQTCKGVTNWNSPLPTP